MFDDLVESTSEKKKTNKGWAVILSGLVQTVILGILILIPLIYTEALPKAMLATLLVAPPPPPPPPPPPAKVEVIRRPQVHLMDAGKLMAPKAIPKNVTIIKEEAEPDMGGEGGVVGGVGGGSLGGVTCRVTGETPGPPKPVQSRIKVGGNV